MHTDDFHTPVLHWIMLERVKVDVKLLNETKKSHFPFANVLGLSEKIIR